MQLGGSNRDTVLVHEVVFSNDTIAKVRAFGLSGFRGLGLCGNVASAHFQHWGFAFVGVGVGGGRGLPTSFLEWVHC
jgi:hypothetical protein